MDEANLNGCNLSQGKKDYETGGNFYGIFLAPKTKYCLTIDNNVMIHEQKTVKGFNDSKGLLDRSQNFRKIQGKKISAMLPKSWTKLFNSGIVRPVKMRFCKECTDKLPCNTGNIQINENKEFEAHLNLLKSQAPIEFGNMLP